MNEALTDPRKLQQLLDNEVVLMRSLDQILTQEETVLINNEAEKLGVITPEKNAVLMQILELEKNRNQLLTSIGYAPDAKGMQDFFAASVENTPLKEMWETQDRKSVV